MITPDYVCLPVCLFVCVKGTTLAHRPAPNRLTLLYTFSTVYKTFLFQRIKKKNKFYFKVNVQNAQYFCYFYSFFPPFYLMAI